MPSRSPEVPLVSAKVDERRRRREEEHRRLRDLANRVRAVRNDSVRAARTRLARFEEAGPPRRPPKEQNVRMRLRGGRTGKRALTCAGLSVCDLTAAFDLEVWFGERVTSPPPRP